MTQIKGTFQGCGEAPAPLKLNEVFISHADSTLNTARSRAVTVNVSLQRIHCLFSLANGPEKNQRMDFFMLYFMLCSHPVPPFHTPGLPSSTFTIPSFCNITHHHQSPSPLSSPSCLSSRRKPAYCGFLLDLKPHSGVNVREV